MFKKGDFASYFLGVIVGISAGLLLTLKFWGHAWWQSVIACLVGFVVGLFVADWRAMLKLISQSARQAVKFHFSKTKTIGKKKVVEFFCGCFLIWQSIIFYVISFYAACLLSHVPLRQAWTSPGNYLECCFAIFFGITFFISTLLSLEDYVSPKETIIMYWKLIVVVSWFLLRLVFFAAAYLIMTIPFFLLFILYFCQSIWKEKEKKLLFAAVCIVFGIAIGTFRRSYFYGIFSGCLLFSLTNLVDRIGLKEKAGAMTPYLLVSALWRKIPVFKFGLE
jgi:hypothetical protein